VRKPGRLSLRTPQATINNPECRTLGLTAEHIELVTQDHQFGVFDVRTAPAADEQAE